MSDVNQNASGVTDAETSGQSQEPEKKDSVAYDTYRKLLGEKKKRDEELEAAKARLSELQKAERERHEAELKQKEDFKSLLQLREEEMKKKDSELHELKSSLEAGAKLRAFLDSVNGVVEKQYWTLVDIDQIKIDPTTNMPDPISVESLARKFEQEYGLVLKAKGAPKTLPNTAAQGTTAKITVSEWKALKSSKEMKEKMHLVDWNTP